MSTEPMVTVPAWSLLQSCRYAMGRSAYASAQTARLALQHVDALRPYADSLCLDIDLLPDPDSPMVGLQLPEDIRPWLELRDRLRQVQP